jgi:hypothetical protein
MGALDCIYNLSTGWNGLRIRLLAPYGQAWVQAVRSMSAIVCDDTHLLLSIQSMIIFVVDTSGWHTTLTGSMWNTPSATIIDPRRRSSSGAQN